jgi:hypothetical protein
VTYCSAGDAFAGRYALSAGCADVRAFQEAEPSSFGLVLVGQGFLDRVGVEAIGRIAEQNHATLAIDVLDLRLDRDQLAILKDMGRGCREEWLVEGPAVCVLSEKARRAPYVSRYKRRVAALNWRAELHSASSPSTLAATPWSQAKVRVQLARYATAAAGTAEDRLSRAFGTTDALARGESNRIIQAEPEICARHLLRYLAHHGFLPELGNRPPDVSPAGAGSPEMHSADRMPRAGTQEASPTRAATRGPRQREESAARLARRPRPVQATALRTKMQSGRAPRTAQQSDSSIARRPRQRD